MKVMRTAGAFVVTATLTLGLGACSEHEEYVLPPEETSSVTLGTTVEVGALYTNSYQAHPQWSMTMKTVERGETSETKLEVDRTKHLAKSSQEPTNDRDSRDSIVAPDGVYERTKSSSTWTKRTDMNSREMLGEGDDLGKLGVMFASDGPATFVREDTIDGEPMRVYHGDVRFAGNERDRGGDPSEIWVDRAGNLRRIQAEHSATSSRGTDDVVTIDFDWKARVDLDVPHESAVTATRTSGSGTAQA